MSDSKLFQDEVLEKAHQFARDVVAEAVKKYPRPPGLRKMSKQEQLQEYLAQTPQTMDQLLQQKMIEKGSERGKLEVEKYIASMEQLKRSGV